MSGRQHRSSGKHRTPFSPKSLSRTTLALISVLVVFAGGGVVLAAELSSSSPSTSTTTSAPGGSVSNGGSDASVVLASGPDQSIAPVFPVAGGSLTGYGSYNALSCSTATKCVEVGAGDKGLAVSSVSTDGGQTWTVAPPPTGTPTLDGVDCVDSSHCVGVGRGAMVSSQDGGSTWSVSTIPVAETTMIGVSCTSTSSCVAAGVTADPSGPLQAALVRSTDGGSHWTQSSSPPSSLGVGAIACPTATLCIAVGATVLVSHDGGASFAQVGVANGIQALRSISCSNATTCVAVGQNAAGGFNSQAAAEVIVTSDGGQTWSHGTAPAGSASIDQVTCPTTSTCLATGPSPDGTSSALLYSSGDQGSTWKIEPSQVASVVQPSSLLCTSSSHCVAAGRQADGSVVSAETSDRANWASQTPSGFSPAPLSSMGR